MIKHPSLVLNPLSNMKFLCIAAVLCSLGLQAQGAPSKTLTWGMPKMSMVKGAKPTVTINSQIVGGTLATLGQYPYQANLIIDGNSICGGSLIGGRWILTAAHCLKGKTFATVRLGTLNWRLAATSEPSRVTLNSTLFFVHPQYNSNGRTNNDVALIKLPAMVNNNAYISTIMLASDATKTYAGFDGSVSGWGWTKDNGTASSVLYGVNLPIITNTVCQQTYGTANIIDSTICASGAGTKSTCRGDSGGPLTVMDAGVRKQVGVVSFGLQSCASGYPQAFARVTSFVTWISQTMNAN